MRKFISRLFGKKSDDPDLSTAPILEEFDSFRSFDTQIESFASILHRHGIFDHEGAPEGIRLEFVELTKKLVRSHAMGDVDFATMHQPSSTVIKPIEHHYGLITVSFVPKYDYDMKDGAFFEINVSSSTVDKQNDMTDKIQRELRSATTSPLTSPLEIITQEPPHADSQPREGEFGNDARRTIGVP